MPHDAYGQEVKVGDEVIIRAVVTNVNPGTDFCNLTVETKEPMHPGTAKTTLTFNTKQVEVQQKSLTELAEAA